jgi:hypothetical protein
MTERELELINNYQDLRDSLSVSIKIDHLQIFKIIVEDLTKKRNASSGKIRKSFNDVLQYYLGEEDFKKDGSLKYQEKFNKNN